MADDHEDDGDDDADYDDDTWEFLENTTIGGERGSIYFYLDFLEKLEMLKIPKKSKKT